MTDSLISVEKISKRYRLKPTTGTGWHKNQHVLVDDLASVFNAIKGKATPSKINSFWALQDVSFSADPGDIIGIIGRNGAGKSTLLKILSRVTEPTSGRAIVNGRLGSLLEVGTGFHSELTGRENIFISGAIIGMSRAEIKQKFDEIVDFSGVRDFLDTPVKRFSSGMEVRLAFSVAAHLHPQVLLVDEVLSIGDAEFQKKSLEKIKKVAMDGGTVLFISHNMTTVAGLCSKVLVLDHGKVIFPLGETPAAIEYYHSFLNFSQPDFVFQKKEEKEETAVRITGLRFFDEHHLPAESLTASSPVDFVIDYEFDREKELTDTYCSLAIQTLKGELISRLTSNTPLHRLDHTVHSGSVACRVKNFPLNPGLIRISLQLERRGEVLDLVEDAYTGLIDAGGRFTKRRPENSQGWVLLDGEWISAK
jgi:lipopolysaccharide transport system ATP-binding protein